jgi:hypothetical protein
MLSSGFRHGWMDGSSSSVRLLSANFTATMQPVTSPIKIYHRQTYTCVQASYSYGTTTALQVKKKKVLEGRASSSSRTIPALANSMRLRAASPASTLLPAQHSKYMATAC